MPAHFEPIRSSVETSLQTRGPALLLVVSQFGNLRIVLVPAPFLRLINDLYVLRLYAALYLLLVRLAMPQELDVWIGRFGRRFRRR